MKKKYFTPEVITVEFGTVNMLAASRIDVEQDGPKVPSAAGSSRGEWGNLW